MRGLLLTTTVAIGLLFSAQAGQAETLYGALAKAYENNSSLNSTRAGVRVTDEAVPLAKSGLRPRITGTAGISSAWQTGSTGVSSSSFGIEINQALFDGFQTQNNVKAAKAQVLAQRENLRNSEQNTLFDTVSAYMDVIQNRQIASLRAQNLEFLDEQVRASNARLEVGEGTRTDVSQATAQRAAAQAQLTAARAAAESAAATLRQLTASDITNLSSAQPISKGLPSSLDAAQQLASLAHPAILAQQHLVDAGVYSVKAAEGAFLPQVGLSAGLDRTWSSGSRVSPSDSASIGAQITVPIYQGGQASASVRQEKERLGQSRIDVDVTRDQVRAAVTSAWSQLYSSQAALNANNESVNAARLALDGVVQERDVGQRTTLDVLDAQATVLSAQIEMVQAQRNQVVASYALLSAVGRLSADYLGLGVKKHKPEEHYEAVQDKWFGLRTPDGR